MKKIFFSKECLNYGAFHIEGPERIEGAVKGLKEKGYLFCKPEIATEKELLLVHSKKYIEELKRGELMRCPDTPVYDGIYDHARFSAGSAISAAKSEGFSMMRPPGHHVGSEGFALGVKSRGFCYLNNIAIAVKCLGKRTLIIDIDGHHGNGTEEIFKGNKDVSFLSLHCRSIYPGTGLSSQGNCFNFPLRENCGGDIYLRTLKRGLRMIDMEKVELIAVSAGFDGFKGDLASLGLAGDDFFEIGKLLGKEKRPTFFVLEGGYVSANIEEGIDKILKGFERK